MGWSGNPLRDYDRHDREMERSASRLPICFYCGERVFGDFVFVLGDKKCICEDCMNNNHRQYVDDYVTNMEGYDG